MTEHPAADAAPTEIADIPMQPTGSGVADLEVAYEKMKLAEAADLGDEAASDDDPLPTTGGTGAAESEAHPT